MDSVHHNVGEGVSSEKSDTSALSDEDAKLITTDVKIEFGATQSDLDLCFNNVGHILTVLLKDKLDDKFLEILYQLKPIKDIDDYMRKFNFDKEVAIKQNNDLKSILQLWREESKQMRSESEMTLKSVSINEEFVKFLEMQEKDYLNSVSKLNNKAFKSHNSDKSIHNDQQFPKSKNDSDCEDQVVLTIRSDFKSQAYTLSQAMNLIKTTKELYDRQHTSNRYYNFCVDVLFALNKHNKTQITRWDRTEDMIVHRHDLWNTRYEEKNHQKVHNTNV